jgi:hypothetical protein
MIMEIVPKSNKDDMVFCVKVTPAIVNFQGTGIDGKPNVVSEFRPMGCLRNKCEAYWCDEHQGCFEKCRYIHESDILNDDDSDDDSTE